MKYIRITNFSNIIYCTPNIMQNHKLYFPGVCRLETGSLLTHHLIESETSEVLKT